MKLAETKGLPSVTEDVFPGGRHPEIAEFTYKGAEIVHARDYPCLAVCSVLASNIVPFTQLSSDLTSGAVPNFAYLLPNAENDAHDCPTGGSMCPDSDKLAAADNWLKANLDPLITNPALANSVFIVLFDEALDTDSTNGGGRVARGSGRSPCQAGIHVHHVLPAPEHVATDAGTALSSRQARTLGDSSGDGGVLSVEDRSHSQPFSS